MYAASRGMSALSNPGNFRSVFRFIPLVGKFPLADRSVFLKADREFGKWFYVEVKLDQNSIISSYFNFF
ncbi:hypothetical protein FDUTEX481_01293 [Tolypothrix sp. PCC 7601]|nr:hypothetical protein FDUTEX481_01293 [Tolypothrix sp. PCC 7601]